MLRSLVGSEMCIRDRSSACTEKWNRGWPWKGAPLGPEEKGVVRPAAQAQVRRNDKVCGRDDGNFALHPHEHAAQVAQDWDCRLPPVAGCELDD
eukprot:TRINITY_DN107_c0_g1_i7.p1 TRINITY_DN107_c0_g1~~TRINITY_DN107_c0_g1_i7.p1  ORF type:complete len:109 (+),score=27.21 TRINITY_DN107_c0_g1_i7:46-327(+)